jgi:hypothetical protein
MTNPLDSLHDFYAPEPPAWMPQTIGWYCVFASAVIAALWLVVHEVRKWRLNRYRREALKELETLKVVELSALLKRTALSAWPREAVASLSGMEWLNFLDETVRGGEFLVAPGNQIENLAFLKANLNAEDERQLRGLTAKWIRSHRVRA